MYIRRYFAITIAVTTFALNTNPASGHSVPQIETTTYLTAESIALIQAHVAANDGGLKTGEVISYIVEFLPIENGATVGAGGYITNYIPNGVEVIGASIVKPDVNGGWVTIPPRLPGPMPNGWARDEHSWNLAPFSNPAYDPSGACTGANTGAKCNGSVAMLYADTGIFYSTDSRTKVLTGSNGRIIQGVGGYGIQPTGGGKISAILGQDLATTHNLWDADQTNAFGSEQSKIDQIGGLFSPVSSVKAIDTVKGAGKGTTPFNAGSPVAGPLSGYQLDNTGQIGPWQRIAYPGSRIGNLNDGPATSKTASTVGPDSLTSIRGDFTAAGYELSLSSPLPANTTAVRWAVGELIVGEIRHVRVSFRLTQDAPSAGIINNSEVFGGDSAQAGGKDGKDNQWRYHVPSVAYSDSSLFVAISVTAVNGVPYDGSIIPENATLTYKVTFLNTSESAHQNVKLTGFFPQ
ncbi:MAG TPA: hypothetical protein EYN06_10140, partial [Myxococcales bacterium]|nr:hypothetical protein [Myxococcales bacterium]